ncbi:MAG: TonB-dependent receptor [Gammaproteobacteria bacterium]|nr:TonB-dependent receptor [Gammaproteobacteria bacterium]
MNFLSNCLLKYAVLPGLLFASMPGHPQDRELDENIDQLMTLSLEELLNIKVTTASGLPEDLRNAPASMVVITAKEIKRRGYANLPELLMDQPGLDFAVTNGAFYMTMYQRGYRTPFTQRTLFMINGVEDNNLWTGTANISRQYPISNIKQVEILYGPASVVYGPNAFTGVINVITYDGGELEEEGVQTNINISAGSYHSRGLDATVRGKLGEDFNFSLAAQIFKSDEADLSERFAFVKNEQYSDPEIWGSMLKLGHAGRKFGEYYDPTDDYGVLGNLRYKNFKLGFIHWYVREAEGVYYAADRAQNNAVWTTFSEQVFADYAFNVSEKLKSKTHLLYRHDRMYGYWVEAEPDPAREGYSYISFTRPNSLDSSWLFRQTLEWQIKDDLRLVTGLKYERKKLTKIYDYPGYWEGVLSTSAPVGSAIQHSSDSEYTPGPPPGIMPAYNFDHPKDVGGYVQAIHDWNKYRFNLGLRYDRNSNYGSVVTPRMTGIYKPSDSWTYKLSYAEAFQEPAGIQLGGVWNGRNANPDLQPEKTRNLEFIAMYHTKRTMQEISLFRAHYDDVVKEEAKNAGERDIWGLEYRAKYMFNNFLESSSDISLYFNYSYVHERSSIHYDPVMSDWTDGETNIGDIAPHKFNVGVNLPVGQRWNVNLRGNFVGKRKLYSRNPLRWQGKTIDPYFVLNGTLRYQYRTYSATFKVLNMLDKEYFHPGVEGAESGDDASRRSLGYRNSLLPQPGRSFWLMLGAEF